MTVVEYEGRIVVVDTGLRFPTADMLGIDLVLPDFSYLRERAEDIEAIVITHGHEDHLGALPWVLRELGDDCADRLRRPADDRDGPLEARRAPAARRRARGPRVPGDAVDARPVHDRARAHDALDPRLLRGGADHRARDGRWSPATTSSTRRRSTGRRRTSRGWPSSGREGVLLLCGDSTNADRPGFSPSERGVGPHLRGGVRARRGADRRHELRLEHPPRAAGDRRRRGARAQGLAGRALDAQERQHRPLARPHRGSRGDADPAPGGRGLARPQGGRDLDRLAGRAAVGAAADGPQRPSHDQAPPRRHGRVLGHADPRQRARGQRDGRPALPHRLRRDHPARGADPRLRPRLRRGAQADAQPGQAALRAADPRRPQAHPPARAARRRGRDRPRRRVPGRERPAARDRRARRALRRARAVGHDLRRRRRHRGSRPTSRCATGGCSPADGIFIVVATISEQTRRVGGRRPR